MIQSQEHRHCCVRAALAAMLAVGLMSIAVWSISVLTPAGYDCKPPSRIPPKCRILSGSGVGRT
jgi:hypothetical protein